MSHRDSLPSNRADLQAIASALPPLPPEAEVFDQVGGWWSPPSVVTVEGMAYPAAHLITSVDVLAAWLRQAERHREERLRWHASSENLVMAVALGMLTGGATTILGWAATHQHVGYTAYPGFILGCAFVVGGVALLMRKGFGPPLADARTLDNVIEHYQRRLNELQA